jgi:hypothetical protein
MEAREHAAPAEELVGGETIHQTTGIPLPVLPEHLQEFSPLSERQQRFVNHFQQLTNSDEWPSAAVMRALSIRDAQYDFVERRRAVLVGSSISVQGVIKACQQRHMGH